MPSPLTDRDHFETWYAQAFGVKPQGDLEALRDRLGALMREAGDVQRTIESIEKWESGFQAALYAWREAMLYERERKP